MTNQRGKRYSQEQIIRLLKAVEAGTSVAEISRQYGVSENTVYRWKSRYGDMEAAELQRRRELEIENTRLKRIVAQQALDLDALKELLAKKW
jgi:putative transposase